MPWAFYFEIQTCAIATTSPAGFDANSATCVDFLFIGYRFRIPRLVRLIVRE
jgi:hypothetical protein